MIAAPRRDRVVRRLAAAILRPPALRTPAERYRGAVIFWAIIFLAVEVQVAIWLGWL